jgi:hypothetical protein
MSLASQTGSAGRFASLSEYFHKYLYISADLMPPEFSLRIANVEASSKLLQNFARRAYSPSRSLVRIALMN